jgi:hypothetical protein
MTNLTNPIFTDEDKAREHFEALRWADGVYCPKCGATENIKKLEGRFIFDMPSSRARRKL